MRINTEITILELIEKARKEKVRIEISVEPNEYGRTNRKIEVEPWEPYTPVCPYGVPIVSVKEKNDI